jgi:hypothetical protein
MSSKKSEIMPPLAPRPRGRPFQKGNAGRRPGSRNKTTVVAEALLRDEEIELVRTAIEMAKAGDAQMLKFLLFVKGAGFIFLDPDADQLAREITRGSFLHAETHASAKSRRA